MKARHFRPRLAAACLLVACVATLPNTVAPLSAQTAMGEAPSTETPERGPWWTLWSWESPHDRAIVGMTTAHVYALEDGFANNWAFGAVVEGMFAATFITTHGPRGWAAGFERVWAAGGWGPIETMAGFRSGLVYGYDRRLGWVAEELPILPYGQPVLMARSGPVSVDLTYTWVVFSFTLGVTLW